MAKGDWSDDEEDTPLAFVAAVKTVPEKPKAKLQEKKQAERKEKPKQEKKSKASTNGAAASSKVNNANAGRGREATRSSKTPSWQKVFNDHGSKIAVAVCMIAILYFRVSEEGWTGRGGLDGQANMENPFKVLGVSSSASDKEVKQAYRKISLELHPDKNPDATPEDHENFARITQAYKVLSDPEKRRRWLNNENPDHQSLTSDTESLTDKTMDSQLKPKSAWLIMAYADWSGECWDLQETWEQSAKDLGRYVQVGRIDIDKETKLAKKFNTMSVPMIYSYVDGQIQTFYGEPTHANITVFLTKSLGESVQVVRDATGGSFLSENPHKVKSMLFAPPGGIKLRLAFRAMARKFPSRMDFGEVTVVGSDMLRTLYNVEKEPSILIAKENGEKPYSYTGSMTFSRINQIFAQHQFDPVTRVTVHNYKTMCGMGNHGEGPCIIYLHDSSKDSEADLQAAKSAMRAATLEDMKNATQSEPERFATAFGYLDLAQHPALKRGPLGSVTSKIVAIMARSKAYLPFEGDATSDQELLGFSRSLEGMEGTDFDALPAGGFDLTHEALPWNWKADLRRATPHLMSLIALTAVVLLWYALQNLYTDYMDQKKKGNLRRGIELARQRQLEAEVKKNAKWQAREEENRKATEAKRKEAEEKERKRAEAMREASAEKEREALARQREEAAARAAAKAAQAKAKAAAQAQAKPKPAPAVVPAASKPAGVSDAELKQAIIRLVAGGDLNTLTKRAVREQLQAAYPSVDLLARKDLVMGEIENAVKNRLAGGK